MYQECINSVRVGQCQPVRMMSGGAGIVPARRHVLTPTDTDRHCLICPNSSLGLTERSTGRDV
jgi:hypothetical protein